MSMELENLSQEMIEEMLSYVTLFEDFWALKLVNKNLKNISSKFLLNYFRNRKIYENKFVFENNFEL